MVVTKGTKTKVRISGGDDKIIPQIPRQYIFWKNSNCL